MTLKRNQNLSVFKFVHTADIHLDSPLKSLAFRDPQIADLVGGATHRVFERIVAFCVEAKVDALIIAGDLFDGDVRSMKTVLFLDTQLRLLEEAGIRVYMIRGNHDSESSRITQQLTLPSNVHVFPAKGGVKELGDCGVAIHGVSYSEPHAPGSLLGYYGQPVPGLINIGIMHTSLAGAASCDVYAPCSENDLRVYGFDYWALGHIHQRRVYSQDPWIVMSGIPQGRDVQESGPKSVSVVEVSNVGIRVEERFVAIAEFRSVKVNLTRIDEWQGALDQLGKELKNERDCAKAEYLICRIILMGRSSLFWRLRRDRDLFEEHVKSIAQQLNKVMVDGIDNQLESAHQAADVDPVDELEMLMRKVVNDSVFRNEAAQFLDEAVRKLPPGELREQYGLGPDTSEKQLSALLDEGILGVVAALKGGQTQSEAT